MIPSPAPFLELRSIGKTFPGVRALDSVSLDLRRGEIHALCGENGAGKSTLIKVLCGAIPAGSFQGEIALEGRSFRFRSPRDAEAQGIALIAQELVLVPDLSVEENLLLGREPARRGWILRGRLGQAARDALVRVGLEVDPEKPVKDLGIGQQQMVEIARALAKDASILVLDEPTAALSEGDAARLFRLLRELRDRGVSSIYISHRIEEILSLSDRVTVLRDGRSIFTRPTRDVTRAEIISAMVGRTVEHLYPRPPATQGPALLSVEGLTLDDPLRRGRPVLHDVGFRLHAGEILGVAGLMGAGRTALLAALFGAARAPVRGRISLRDGPPRAPFRSPAEAIAAGIALVTEDRKRFGLVPEGSLRDNLTLATLRRFARAGWLDESARTTACDDQVRALAVRHSGLETRVAALSGGNQQKVLLGRWLLAEPAVLLLDEPTRGIDVGAKAEIYEIIAALAERGLGVLLVSSDLPELLGLSHRLLVLAQGRVSAALSGDADPREVLAAATGGQARRDSDPSARRDERDGRGEFGENDDNPSSREVRP